jgi:hypothetical protein
MLSNIRNGIGAFIILALAYFLVSGLSSWSDAHTRLLDSHASWWRYPEMIVMSAIGSSIGVLGACKFLDRIFEDYPECTDLISFAAVMLALDGLTVVGQIQFPAHDLLFDFISP